MKQIGKLVGLTAAVVLSFSLTACSDVPTKMIDGREKMENEGYTVTTLSTDDIFEDLGEEITIGIKTAIECEKETTEDFLVAIWFETKENAKDFQTLFKMMENVMNEEFEGTDIKTEYKVDGKVFYYGTEQACEDFTA